ncbi:MAG: RNA methyltransferase [Spirochaetaceae bacterium]|nr:MAG: RNA methyltransferase [Spirochaetaceae bacterium]
MKRLTKPDSLSRLRVILTRPKDPRNIGSVCRAMKTMGLTDLAIVADRSSGDQGAFFGPRLESEVLASRTAVHADDILKKACRHENLEDALADTVLAAGITRRRGKFRKYNSLTPEEFAAKALTIKKGKIAVVFGAEEDGLLDKELDCCQLAVHIPSSPLFPSLNLSHAVQIMAYTLFREAQKDIIRAFTPVTIRELEESINHIISLLEPLDFYKNEEAKNLALFLKDILGRSCLSRGELERYLTLFIKISGVFTNLNRKAAPPEPRN